MSKEQGWGLGDKAYALKIIKLGTLKIETNQRQATQL